MAQNPAFTSAGTSLEVGLYPATYNQAGFEAVTYTLVGEITDMGEFGREYTVVNHNPLNTRQTIKRKGSFNDGQMQLQMARVPSDAGQAVLITALNSDDSYAFKVTLQDGTIEYFSGQVTSYTTNIGSVDQITQASVTIEIDDAIIEVVAP